MAKILISSLGTGSKQNGEYQKVSYKLDDNLYSTSFIADALVQHLKIDKLFLVGTNKSIWDGAYSSFGGEDEEYQMKLYEKQGEQNINEDDLLLFNEILCKKLDAPDSKASVIKYGIDEDELWSIFESYLEIAKTIKDGDELYLDITHSFRSLSMMSLIMTQFASSISDKNFSLEGVFYGMFEYKSETKDKSVPVVDLSILFELQEWIKAIEAIKKYSDFNPLVEILKKEKVEVKVSNAFKELNNAIDMANMAAMQKFVRNANKKINAITQSDNKVIKLLAKEVITLVNELDYERMSDFQYALAKWFYKNKNYAMSYMALAEAIVTKNCELKLLDRNDLEKENQKRVKSIDYPYDKYFQSSFEGSISDIRNNIAHQLEKRSDNTTRDIEKLKFFIEKFVNFFKKERKEGSNA